LRRRGWLALIHLGHRRRPFLSPPGDGKRPLDSVMARFDDPVLTPKECAVFPVRMPSSAAVPDQVTHEFPGRAF
jgi:hypothetical protein